MDGVRRRRWVALLVAGVLVLAAGCSDDSGDGDSAADDTTAEATTTTAAPEPLQILVTNDDGVTSEGIDVLIDGLMGLDDVELTVVAPADQQSGTSDQTSPQPPAATETTTSDGVPAVAVDGFPADSVNHALAETGVEFDLVVSGINEGQNVGRLRNLSGTVGAAATAARAGVAALAASQGFGDPLDYGSGAELAVAWVEENREAIEAGELAGALWSLNIPTCPTGSVRGVAEVPPDDQGDEIANPPDCESTLEDPVDDIEAMNNGFASLSELDPAVTGQSVAGG